MKVVITIEDLPDGGAFISTDPAPHELRRRSENPAQCTSAEGYAFAALLAINAAARAEQDATKPEGARRHD